MQREHHDHISEALEAIDRELARPPISIEDAINDAVQAGRMTIKDAVECMEAYERTFNLGRVAFEDGGQLE